MGAENSTYVGIYLEIPFRKHEQKVMSYNHPVTGRKMKNKFCPDSGAECVATTKVDITYVEPDAYIQKEGFEEDTFFSPAYTGGGNRVATFILNDSRSLEELENRSLTHVDIAGIIDIFKISYKKYIEYYTDLYGKVDIHYGVVNYAH